MANPLYFQMCLNGKCVAEHENAVDYAGDGFLRRSGESINSVYKDDHQSSEGSR